MNIQLNKVGVEIDGKVYQMYKLNLGFRRAVIEVQSSLRKLKKELAKKYDIGIDEVELSDKVSEDEKLEMVKIGLALQSSLSKLFVNPKEAVILDSFDDTNIGELIKSLE